MPTLDPPQRFCGSRCSVYPCGIDIAVRPMPSAGFCAPQTCFRLSVGDPGGHVTAFCTCRRLNPHRGLRPQRAPDMEHKTTRARARRKIKPRVRSPLAERLFEACKATRITQTRPRSERSCCREARSRGVAQVRRRRVQQRRAAAADRRNEDAARVQERTRSLSPLLCDSRPGGVCGCEGTPAGARCLSEAGHGASNSKLRLRAPPSTHGGGQRPGRSAAAQRQRPPARATPSHPSAESGRTTSAGAGARRGAIVRRGDTKEDGGGAVHGRETQPARARNFGGSS